MGSPLINASAIVPGPALKFHRTNEPMPIYEEGHKEQMAITYFCYDAVTGSHPFGHLGLKSSNLHKPRNKVSVSGILIMLICS